MRRSVDMARYQCPKCGTIVEAADPRTLSCPNCGFGSGAPTPSPAGVSAPPPQAAPTIPPAASYPGRAAYTTPTKTSAFPVWALILGILTLLVWLVPFVGLGLVLLVGAAAMTLGFLGFRQAKKTGSGGQGMALTGIMLAVVGILVGTVALLVFAEELQDFLARTFG